MASEARGAVRFSVLQAELDLLGRDDAAPSGHAVYLRSPADRGR
jgi:hypothetical protein